MDFEKMFPYSEGMDPNEIREQDRQRVLAILDVLVDCVITQKYDGSNDSEEKRTLVQGLRNAMTTKRISPKALIEEKAFPLLPLRDWFISTYKSLDLSFVYYLPHDRDERQDIVIVFDMLDKKHAEVYGEDQCITLTKEELGVEKYKAYCKLNHLAFPESWFVPIAI